MAKSNNFVTLYKIKYKEIELPNPYKRGLKKLWRNWFPKTEVVISHAEEFKVVKVDQIKECYLKDIKTIDGVDYIATSEYFLADDGEGWARGIPLYITRECYNKIAAKYLVQKENK